MTPYPETREALLNYLRWRPARTPPPEPEGGDDWIEWLLTPEAVEISGTPAEDLARAVEAAAERESGVCGIWPWTFGLTGACHIRD